MRKISRRSFLKAATVACALTALTACGGGDESAAVSVAKDENGAYVDTLTITLGRFAEPSAAALFPEGQTFEDNAYPVTLNPSSTWIWWTALKQAATLTPTSWPPASPRANCPTS
ncbi:MAG: twin-arginine translocation signal domain-containing protein [Faecalibacterium prausnitzii]|nr:twin-arginine translocation signal domain-containing protein [Faecalibacterium prausnitzii]